MARKASKQELISLTKYRQTHREQARTYAKDYYKKHKAKILKYQKERYQANKERIDAYYNEHNKKRYKDERLRVLLFYGGDPPKCACCGETHFQFLELDHINGGGNKHRKQVGSRNYCHWLIKNNFPTGYRILCSNCNHSKGIYGYCPHEKEKLHLI